MSLGKILTADQVSRAIPGLTPQAVRAAIRKGELHGVKLRGKWYVRESDLEAKFSPPVDEDRERVIRVLRHARLKPRRLALPPTLLAPKGRLR